MIERFYSRSIHLVIFLIEDKVRLTLISLVWTLVIREENFFFSLSLSVCRIGCIDRMF